jgi:hypothetical protein
MALHQFLRCDQWPGHADRRRVGHGQIQPGAGDDRPGAVLVGDDGVELDLREGRLFASPAPATRG